VPRYLVTDGTHSQPGLSQRANSRTCPPIGGSGNAYARHAAVNRHTRSKSISPRTHTRWCRRSDLHNLRLESEAVDNLSLTEIRSPFLSIVKG
jgi:hypothetical protein